jgi:hypothetical protein
LFISCFVVKRGFWTLLFWFRKITFSWIQVWNLFDIFRKLRCKWSLKRSQITVFRITKINLIEFLTLTRFLTKSNYPQFIMIQIIQNFLVLNWTQPWQWWRLWTALEVLLQILSSKSNYPLISKVFANRTVQVKTHCTAFAATVMYIAYIWWQSIFLLYPKKCWAKGDLIRCW